MVKKNKHIAIVYRPHRPKAFQLAKELALWLKLQGVKVYSHLDQKRIPGTFVVNKTTMKKVDFIVVLGGDGTYLRAIRFFQPIMPIPIIGVNMGNLGFLTEVTVQNMYSVIKAALAEKVRFNSLTMLDICVKKHGRRTQQLLALNDLVIERGPNSRLISMAIYSNNALVTELKADGLIISSPTGSTAYNLAAGGPITHPDVRGIVITPICPHSLTIRPITLPDDHEITIKLSPAPTKAFCMIDGQRSEGLSDKDVVTIKKAKRGHLKLQLESHNYFDVLRRKLSFGQRD